MEGYSGTPLWKKLGYTAGIAAFAEGAPQDYLALLALPPGIGVIWLERPRAGMRFVHLFSTSGKTVKARLAFHRRRMASDGVIWVSWPKKSSGVPTDVTEGTIRDLAIPLGLVDIKVCAVDGVWSGLKLMIRRENR